MPTIVTGLPASLTTVMFSTFSGEKSSGKQPPISVLKTWLESFIIAGISSSLATTGSDNAITSLNMLSIIKNHTIDNLIIESRMQYCD
jgi:hypothetical protein